LTISESNSPNIATVGPGFLNVISAREPVNASPVLKGTPIDENTSLTVLPVLISLKPGSGLSKIVEHMFRILSALDSISRWDYGLSF
jgi:hypothetical protein